MRLAALFLAPLLAAPAACGDEAPATSGANVSHSISALQGRGDASPLAGATVTVEGIVTGDFQDGDDDPLADLGGFYLQDEKGDGDPQTSDGIFVYDGRSPATDIGTGNLVRVTGRLQEHFGETQLVADEVVVRGSGTITPTPVDLPAGRAIRNSDGEAVADLERYEGMLVTFRGPLFVSGHHELERFGALLLSRHERLYQFTNQSLPDADGYAAHRRTIAARSIVLDDGQRDTATAPYRYANPERVIRAGDTAADITGALRYARGKGAEGADTWRLMPTVEPVFAATNPRPAAPELPGALRVASFNTLNYFSTVDGGKPVCGPRGASGCRGADSVAEKARQLGKITTALVMLDADIVGLMELENNRARSLEEIVGALNAVLGSDRYAYVETGTIGDDAIKTGFLYRPATVRLAGRFALLDNSVDARYNDDRNRPALAQTFEQVADGAQLTVVVNHLKSKGSGCDADGDPNLDDGQGNCNRTRTAAAIALADWLATDPTGSGDPDRLIIGDLNAYLREDPLRALARAGYTNLRADDGTAYSFIHDGQAGALDHALASPSLLPQVAGAIEWHINADEPRIFDYNLEGGRDPAPGGDSLAYRASDHDPLLVGIDLK